MEYALTKHSSDVIGAPAVRDGGILHKHVLTVDCV